MFIMFLILAVIKCVMVALVLLMSGGHAWAMPVLLSVLGVAFLIDVILMAAFIVANQKYRNNDQDN